MLRKKRAEATSDAQEDVSPDSERPKEMDNQFAATVFRSLLAASERIP